VGVWMADLSQLLKCRFCKLNTENEGGKNSRQAVGSTEPLDYNTANLQLFLLICRNSYLTFVFPTYDTIPYHTYLCTAGGESRDYSNAYSTILYMLRTVHEVSGMQHQHYPRAKHLDIAPEPGTRHDETTNRTEGLFSTLPHLHSKALPINSSRTVSSSSLIAASSNSACIAHPSFTPSMYAKCQNMACFSSSSFSSVKTSWSWSF
jgi:hypothetical protein